MIRRPPGSTPKGTLVPYATLFRAHPARAFAAGRALATAFMHVEIADPADRADDVRGFVHDDDGGVAKAGAKRLQPVEIHRRVHDRVGGHQPHRRSAGDDRKQIVHAAATTATTL